MKDPGYKPPMLFHVAACAALAARQKSACNGPVKPCP